MAPSPSEQVISLIALSVAGLVCLAALIVVVSLRISASFQKPENQPISVEQRTADGDTSSFPAFLVGSLKGLSFPRALLPLISVFWLLVEFLGLNVFAFGRVSDNDSFGTVVNISLDTQRSLCRISLFATSGVGEPGVAWATVFITRLALSDHVSRPSRRRMLQRELFFWVGPNLIYQALIAAIASTEATDGVPKYVGEVVRINDSCNNNRDQCAVCSFPLLSLAGSILFVVVFLFYFTGVCIEIIGSLIFPLVVTFKGITLVSEPRDPLFEAFSLINILAISAATMTLALILVLRPIFEASMAHKAAFSAGWKPAIISQGREENAAEGRMSALTSDDREKKMEEAKKDPMKSKATPIVGSAIKAQREKSVTAYPLQPVRRNRTQSSVELSHIRRMDAAAEDIKETASSSSIAAISHKNSSQSEGASRWQ